MLATVVALGMWGLAYLSFLGAKHGLAPYVHTRLLQFQKGRAASEKGVETIFLGDCVAGYAVDGELMSELTGTKILNLALTGNYGYPAALNMLKYAASHQNLKRAVIMFFPHQLTGEIGYRSFFQTTESFTPFKYSLMESYRFHLQGTRLVNSFMNGLTLLRTGEYSTTDEVIVGNYIRQGKQVGPQEENLERRQSCGVRPINRGKILFVRELADFCRDSGIECLYMHSPIIDPNCDQFSAHMKEINAMIRGTGLTLVGEEPLFMDAADAGDSTLHAAPHSKEKYTRRVYQRLVEEGYYPKRTPTGSGS